MRVRPMDAVEASSPRPRGGLSKFLGGEEPAGGVRSGSECRSSGETKPFKPFKPLNSKQRGVAACRFML